MLVDGTERVALETACRDHLSPEALARWGASGDITLGVYRLVYCLAR
jgi:hypothetical protein